MEYCDFFCREKKRRLFSPQGYFLQLLGQMLPDHPSNDLGKEEEEPLGMPYRGGS